MEFYIKQGSNAPLRLSLLDLPLESTIEELWPSIVEAHAFFKCANTTKRWNKIDMYLDDGFVILPLTQEDTLTFFQGNAILEFKMVYESAVLLTEIAHGKVIKRNDKLPIGDSTIESDKNPEDIQMVVLTDLIKLGEGTTLHDKLQRLGFDESGHIGFQREFTIDDTLSMSEDFVLKVNTTNDAEKDNTLPITSAGVYTTVGNIKALLETI